MAPELRWREMVRVRVSVSVRLRVRVRVMVRVGAVVIRLEPWLGLALLYVQL